MVVELASAQADGLVRPPRGGLRPRRSAAAASELRFTRIPQELRDLIRRDYPYAPAVPIESVPVCHVNLARETRPRSSEMQTALLIRELAARGLQQRLVMRRGGTLDGWLDELPGLTVCPVDGRWSAVRACRKASLIHAHEAHAGQAAWAAIRGRGNYLITQRNVVTREAREPVPRASWLTRRIYGSAGAVVAVSEVVAEDVRKRQVGAEVSLTKIPDAWMSRRPKRQEAREIRARFGDGFLVGHATDMDHEVKGHQVLLAAIRRLEGTELGFQFSLLGGERLEEFLRTQARGLTNVHFADWAEDPLPWMAALDILFLPSLREGLGFMLLDALRMGVPVVACRTGGIPEVVTEDCSVLVPPGDAEALADVLAQLARDPALLERLSRGALDRAEEFSPGKMAERYLEVYRELGLEALGVDD